MRRLGDDPIVAVGASLLVVLLGGALLWAGVRTLEAPTLVFVASLFILWAVTCLLACILLFLGLRFWPVAVVLALLWIGWYGVYAASNLSINAVTIVMLCGVVPACVLLFLGLILVSGYLFPPSSDNLRWKALRALLTFTIGTNHPYYAVVSHGDEENELAERAGGQAYLKAPGIPGANLAVGPGLVLTGCDHAVVLSDGLSFKGVHGPGLVFTDTGDRPIQTIDLRPHYRDFVVKGVTKDGIRVAVGAFVAFELDRGEERPTPSRPFPYRKRAVFAALQAQRMQHLPDEVRERRWYDLPELGARRALQDILSGNPFDKLFQAREGSAPDSHGPSGLEGHRDRRIVGDSATFDEDARSRVVGEFRARLTADLAPTGIRVIDAGITNILPVDGEAVLSQRIESWQAGWVQRIMLRRAEGQAERLRLVAEAWARAQEALILALGKRLVDLHEPGSPVPAEDVARWFLEVLQEMAHRPSVLPLLPQETTDTMDQILRKLEDTRDHV